MSHVGTTSPFLPLPEGIVIASVHPTALQKADEQESPRSVR